MFKISKFRFLITSDNSSIPLRLSSLPINKNFLFWEFLILSNFLIKSKSIPDGDSIIELLLIPLFFINSEIFEPYENTKSEFLIFHLTNGLNNKDWKY